MAWGPELTFLCNDVYCRDTLGKKYLSPVPPRGPRHCGSVMRLRSERIVTPGATISGEVRIAGGLIESVGPAREGPGDVVELGARWLTPGLIDLHVHGGGGAQCNTSDPDGVAAVARFHARHGVTGLLATTVAAGLDDLVDALGAICVVMDRRRSAAAVLGCGVDPGCGATVLGAHLEGPFLNPHRPGAMDPSAFLTPDASALRSLLLAGDGCAAMMTLAPELPGALGLIGELVEAGVLVSLGHSEATYDEARAAVGAGARSATHVFNAMAPFHHRAPGVLGAVLDLPQVSCELICDGVHVDPVAARLLHRIKGTKGIHLVTDAVAATGMPDGSYRLGAVAVRMHGGRVTRLDGDVLAGSTLTMDAAVANAVRWLGITVEEGVGLASANPARLMGLEDRKGAITPGFDADLAVLDDTDDGLRACGTIVAGAWVHGPPSA